ncbi:PhnD/SsuA/transferrin family substrate-binding protein [Lactovum miscens]|uniref:Phosphonate transport system substrate-binding protein n=1 Tax=Lactovum miscens TaxID=190387 RepID=A0A841C5D6_9LACT|nr:PhnD/SsuA/transferrin family substrate-binding protein [Lactovum miscens]MBB5887564.1 phosphonate transport system substrate-binding protein [Lactovum miscens]
MKKSLKSIIGLTAVATVGAVVLSANTSVSAAKTTNIKELKISFIPSKNPSDITTATQGLDTLLKSELKKQGFKVGKITMTTGTDYNAVGKALTSGTADVGYGVSGGTYAAYASGTKVILTATRKGLSNDDLKNTKNATNPQYWNNHKPTTNTTTDVKSYRGLIIAGNTELGKEMAADVKSGKKIPVDLLKKAKWGLSSTTSASGYLYPSKWLTDNYKISVHDLPNVVSNLDYGTATADLASGQVDIIAGYADLRMDFATAWTTIDKATDTIWNQTNVIGVTGEIFNDGILVSTKSDTMKKNPKLASALQKAIIAMSKTDQGAKIIKVYSHDGYQVSSAKDYKPFFKILKDVAGN